MKMKKWKKCDIIEETLKSVENMRQIRSQWGKGTVCLEVN
jgi:hypothetical protein